MLNENETTRVANKSQFNFKSLLFTIGLIVSIGLNICAQTTPQNKSSDDKVDQNLKGSSRVNPSTLAMELNIPLMNYPGRGGNSMAFGFSYSSKVWRMDDLFTYSYQLPYSCTRQSVTQLSPKYGERSISGWTSSISPPIIEERTDIYDVNGKPIGSEFDEVFLPGLLNSLTQNYQSLSENLVSDPNRPCGFFCRAFLAPPWGDGTQCEVWDYNAYCDMNGGHGPINPGEGCGGGPPPDPRLSYYVKRTYLRTSEGATHEFRKSDGRYPYCYATGNPNNGPGCSGLNADNLGTFLSVDGSGLRLERDANGSTLFMPNGSKYAFPATNQHMGDNARMFFATEFQDVNGNTTSFTENVSGAQIFLSQKDTMEREITDPLPQNFGMRLEQEVKQQDVHIPGMGGGTQDYSLAWKRLKPPWL